MTAVVLLGLWSQVKMCCNKGNARPRPSWQYYLGIYCDKLIKVLCLTLDAGEDLPGGLEPKRREDEYAVMFLHLR